MIRTVVYTLLGYLSGSVLYANVFGKMFGKISLYQNSADQNPGTANAYKYGGFWCGTLTLICDLLKGFLPVFLFSQHLSSAGQWGLLPVLVSPVIGHIFPLYNRFRGGKGIATTFGCLLGLFPNCLPVALFAAVFIFFSIGLKVTPNYYRTIVAYLSTSFIMIISDVVPMIWIGFLVITGTVCFRLYLSCEERDKCKVELLWIR